MNGSVNAGSDDRGFTAKALLMLLCWKMKTINKMNYVVHMLSSEIKMSNAKRCTEFRFFVWNPFLLCLSLCLLFLLISSVDTLSLLVSSLVVIPYHFHINSVLFSRLLCTALPTHYSTTSRDSTQQSLEPLFPHVLHLFLP